MQPYVIYWPSTELTIKRCTGVNKRKNSGSKWAWDNNITRCPGWFESVGDRMPAWESACRLRACGPQWPTVEQPQPRWERSAAMVRRTWVQNNCLSPSPTHLSHTTNITLSRIKCERLYFYKEVCSFVHWSSSLCFIMFCIYLYMYVDIQHIHK